MWVLLVIGLASILCLMATLVVMRRNRQHLAELRERQDRANRALHEAAISAGTVIALHPEAHAATCEMIALRSDVQ